MTSQIIQKDLLFEKRMHATENGKYNYCPYCLADFHRKQKESKATVNFRDIFKPLMFRKYFCIEQTEDGKRNKFTDKSFFVRIAIAK